ncbi:GmrSD restriction endonuclease domain-containing protein [Geodermatophilus sp. SYSU D00684]
MHLRPARPRPAPLRAALALGLVAALGSGCTALLGDPPAVPSAGSALEALDSVEVRGRAPQTGYSRDEFGDGWVDTDQNGCDTRNDVLARDLTGERFEPGTRDCVVVSGTLADPYSGRTIAFRRGEGTSEAVQIDHVVALSDAWQKGAQQWDAARRTEFANDPLNLLAVDGPLNQAKGDSDAATWLPPARSYRCAYVARQVAVKVTYGLWMTRAERDAVAGVLDACPDEPLPGRGPLPGQEAPESAPPAPVTPYPDCAAVRAAGAAPLREGDPGWNPSLDGDGDGVGCEG